MAGGGAFAVQRNCNWLQALEGDIDTSHAGFLHLGAERAEDQIQQTFSYYALADRAPRYEVIDTEGGAMYGAYRPGRPGEYFWRIAQFMLPFYTMPPVGLLGLKVIARCWVPIDDEHCFLIAMTPPRRPVGGRGSDGQGLTATLALGVELAPTSTDWYGRFRLVADANNDYQIDRELQRSKRGLDGFTGITSIHLQDQCVTEGMGPIYDRTQEHLATSDAMVIRVRRRLLAAAKALNEYGTTPPGVDNAEAYHVRAGGVFLPQDANWVEATTQLRAAFAEHPELDPSITGGPLG